MGKARSSPSPAHAEASGEGSRVRAEQDTQAEPELLLTQTVKPPQCRHRAEDAASREPECGKINEGAEQTGIP